jgi:hypothetical protein
MLVGRLSRLRAHFRHQFVGYLALFIALGGTGYAATKIGSAGIADNSLRSIDLRDGAGVRGVDVANDSLTNTDLKNGAAVTGAEAVDNSLTSADLKNGAAVSGGDVVDDSVGGADVAESSLGRVPSALLGGLSRSSDPVVREDCDPESTVFVNCAYIGLNLPRAARVFVTGSINAVAESAAADAIGTGQCLLGTTSGNVPFSSFDVSVGNHFDRVSVSGVTGVFPPGEHSFGIDCSETAFPIRYHDARVTVIALSDG